VFRRAADALAPGGHLLVAGRHRDDLGRDGGRGPSDPARRDTPEDLAGSLPHDLDLLRCEAVTRTVPSDDGPVVLTDVVAFARHA
jgi:hypothetical protein